MALPPGTRLGPYEIAAQIGAGGMGEVYRATDTKLKRQVAIKILPASVAADHDRLARFQREAEVLASLNHPNIAGIYGIEESGGTTALVMELVEGEDLSAIIARGPIPIGDALPIARQIADALEAAHEQGIIHRDLKPANIKARPDGTVKVLDFGLAKALDFPASSPNLSQFPTITTPAMTQVGMILGTAAYMSPEQARGKTVDKRTDIWAFGCVLYETLTATRAFAGEDVSDTLANVLKVDPDWSALPVEIPPAIRTLLQSCLTKDRRRRVADISTALFVLDKGAALAAPPRTVSATVLPRRPMWRRVATLTAGAVVVAAVATSLTWVATRPADSPRISRLMLASSGAAALTVGGPDRDLAITPDGLRVVYVGNRGTQLFVRALDDLKPAAVFTGTPRGVFVSPNGQWIGFGDGPSVLKKVALTGGPPETLATLDGPLRGAAWGPEDAIIVATGNGTTGLQRVAVADGATTVLTRPDRAQGELDHLWPELLPGGRAVLFTITALTGGRDAAQVALLDLQTGTRKILFRGGTHAHYVPGGRASPKPGDGGYLVYGAAGTLRAVAFDLAHLETVGTSVPVVTDVVTTSNGGVDAVVAGDGTLVYVSGGGATAAAALRTLVLVDRQGRETPISAPPRAYTYPRLSPDGTRIAVAVSDQENDIWLWDRGGTELVPFTFNPGYDSFPLWTPDSRQLIFSSDREGATDLFWQAANGTGPVQRLTNSPTVKSPTAVVSSPGGRQLIFTETASTKTGLDVMQLELDGTHRVTPLVQTAATERNGIVSPDGRWLAYEASGTSGQFQIYVRPYPDVNGGVRQVSTGGGTRPAWARSGSGQELFFVSTDELMSVRVGQGATWAPTAPTKVLGPNYYYGTYVGRTYDVSPDGQTILMIKEGGGTDQTAAPVQIVVVQHWVEELKRLVPTK